MFILMLSSSLLVLSQPQEWNFTGNLFQNKTGCQGIPRAWPGPSSFLLPGGDQMRTDRKDCSDAADLLSCGVLSGSELRK